MKISKLYSNKSEVFNPILFRDELNVVMGEIRIPENRTKSTHNLGKTTLIYLIDFALLMKRNPDLFLFKHDQIFNSFIFSLEIELDNSTFITIRRSVATPSEICFKKHKERNQNYSKIEIEEWDHQNLTFEKSKILLDGYINWTYLKPKWTYRKSLGYLLRTQDNYKKIFSLINNQKAVDWKPYLAQVFGLDSKAILDHYDLNTQYEQKSKEFYLLKDKVGNKKEIHNINGLLTIKKLEFEKKEKLLNEFNFSLNEKKDIEELVVNYSRHIATLNKRKYSLNLLERKIQSSLDGNKIDFDPNKAEKLFQEAKIYFKDQIKKDFENLIEFNKKITEERHLYLKKEQEDIKSQLEVVEKTLQDLHVNQSKLLSRIETTDLTNKFKTYSNEQNALRIEIDGLERKSEEIKVLNKIQEERDSLWININSLKTQISKNIETVTKNKNSYYTKSLIYFDEIVKEILEESAVLTIATNKDGYLEFDINIVDEKGIQTSAGEGHSYNKILCIAFDLAILRAHLDTRFPRFIFHDGIFESLDDRKKEKLIEVYRKYSKLGIQCVVTVIDSDLYPTNNPNPVFSPDEVILRLHDSGNDGLLFKMNPW